MNVQNISLTVAQLASARHDSTCSAGSSCRSRAWHIQNDYTTRAAKDVISFFEAEIVSARSQFGIR